ELLSFVSIGENFVFSVDRDFNDGSQYTRAVNQAMLAVECVSVGVAECDDFFFLAVWIHSKNLFVGFIAHVEKSRRIPHRPFGKTEIACDLFEFDITGDEFLELRRQRLELEFSCFLRGQKNDCGGKEQNQERNANFHSKSSLR